jgi:signal transduction histidine kinase
MLSPVITRNKLVESNRADELFSQRQQENSVRIDRLFAVLMIIQWLAGVAAALWLSPRTWSGAVSQTHLHVWAAIFLGGIISGLPAYLAWFMPGRRLTRHVVAIGQMLTSALLIHLTGGRIETHFHIFGSLAFLACYRDWRVLVTSTIVVAADHWIRGIFWPESVYGILSGASLRFIEHAGWVVFEDIFLCVTIRQSLAEIRRNAEHQAHLESINEVIESEVQRRTEDLHRSVEETANANRKLAQTNQILEEKNKELDQFTYIASHDLQEPVRKLVSFSSLLKQDIGSNLNDDAARDLAFIVDAAKRMKNLVQALLELSRVGRSAMRKEVIALDDCVEDALIALGLRIEETQAQITRDELPLVMGDPTMLTQLYQNLIGNSLKFIKDKQPVIHLTAIRQGEQWILGVRDNGIGMKPEYAERVFQPFQRLHNRGEYEGTGIGLSICKKTVQRHDGDIWVESELGHGAHFRFSLPVAKTTLSNDTLPCHEAAELITC